MQVPPPAQSPSISQMSWCLIPYGVLLGLPPPPKKKIRLSSTPNLQKSGYIINLNIILPNHQRSTVRSLFKYFWDFYSPKEGSSFLYIPEMNIPKEIRSSVPDPLLSTIDCILGLTQLCRLSSPAALQVAWSCCREFGQYYIKSVENSKIAKHALPPWIFYEPDLSKCTSFVTQFITYERYIHVWKQPSFKL